MIAQFLSIICVYAYLMPEFLRKLSPISDIHFQAYYLSLVKDCEVDFLFCLRIQDYQLHVKSRIILQSCQYHERCRFADELMDNLPSS